MKTFYLLFGFALMGVLFFACQKDEPVVEEVAVGSNEMVSVERVDYLPCFQRGNCPCIVMTATSPTLPHNSEICIRSVDFTDPPQSSFGGPVPIAYPCNIPPSSNCDIDYPNVGFGFMLPFHHFGGINYGDFYYFCLPPGNAIRICNPHSFPIDMHLMCNPDAPNHQMVTFTLQASECRYFNITNHCHITDCN